MVTLLSHALALGARPRLRLFLEETDDAEKDIARARPLFEALASHPGREAVLVTIQTLDGKRRQVLFRCRVDRGLIAAVGQALRQGHKNGRQQEVIA